MERGIQEYEKIKKSIGIPPSTDESYEVRIRDDFDLLYATDAPVRQTGPPAEGWLTDGNEGTKNLIFRSVRNITVPIKFLHAPE